MSIITLAIKAAETNSVEDFRAVLKTADDLPEHEQALFNDMLLKIQWKQAQLGQNSMAYVVYLDALVKAWR